MLLTICSTRPTTNIILFCHNVCVSEQLEATATHKKARALKARFPWSVFWSGFGADIVRALSSPGKA